MNIMLLMAAGILIGLRFFPKRLNPINLRIQMVCTALLIFAMGVSLGSQPDFLSRLSQMGLQSLVLTVLGIAFSVQLVWLMTRRWKS